MDEPNRPDEPVESPRSRKAHNGLLYGCLAGGMLLVAGAVGVYIGVPYLLDNAFKAWFLEYSETAPKAIPVSTMFAPEYELLDRRFREFTETVDSNERPAELMLSAEDCNALIENSPEFSRRRRQVFVSMEEGHMRVDFSVPLDDADKEASSESRWLNGNVTLEFELVDGTLKALIRSLEMKGKNPFEEVSELVEFPFFLMELPDIFWFAQTEDRLEHFDVEDGRLVIRVGTQK